MIHQLLNLTRPLIVFDCETTGVDVKNDRIVEIGFQVWTTEGLQKEYRTLVNPDVPIPQSAIDAHGITDEMIQGCRSCSQGGIEKLLKRPMRPLDHPVSNEGFISSNPDGVKGPCIEFKPWPRFRDLAANLAKGFTDCDFAGKNVRFDLRITAAEMARHGVEWSYLGARIVDIDRLEAWLNKRSLSHLHRKYIRRSCDDCGGKGTVLDAPPRGQGVYEDLCPTCYGVGTVGVKLEGAHGALTDVQGSTRVLERQFVSYAQNEDEPLSLPRDLDQLHALQWPGWIDNYGKFKFVGGVACFTGWGKYANKPMATADVGYWDWILKNDFEPEVKALAGRAKLGQFPEEKPT